MLSEFEADGVVLVDRVLESDDSKTMGPSRQIDDDVDTSAIL